MEAIANFLKNILYLGMNEKQIYELFYKEYFHGTRTINEMIESGAHTIIFIGIWILIITFSILSYFIIKKSIKLTKFLIKRKKAKTIDNK